MKKKYVQPAFTYVRLRQEESIACIGSQESENNTDNKHSRNNSGLHNGWSNRWDVVFGNKKNKWKHF